MKNIFVSNLSYQLNSEDLQEAFEAYGEVVSAKIIMDKFTGRSRGFGFVEMSNDDSADEAISALNGAEMDGKAISVAEARPREERPRNKTPYNNARSGGNRGGGGRNNSGGYNRNNRY
ncbi:MAG: RNA-binding protein [Prevotellaceae bacterium]|jgi:RNA recognition motif-containing protein|nr:RNA-binding protein [Prevotellaceae bacterium]